MIERGMVRRMILRGLVLAPVIVAALWLWRGQTYAWSGAVGLALTLGNLWLSARIIGGVAESSPQLLMPAALATFALGLLLLTAVALALQSADLVFFPVTGFVLIGSHLGLVLWEAAGAYGRIDSPTEKRPSRGNVGVRS